MTAGQKARAKILLAENDAELLESTKQLLTLRGFKVTAVSDGEKALEKVYEDRPDLVLVDVLLKGKNGFEVCRTLKDPLNPRGAFYNIPVGLMVEETGSKQGQYAKTVQADGFIVKPFTLTYLLDKVNKLLEKKK